MEDVWKPLTPNKPMSDERQTNISKYMCKKSNDIICDLLFYFVLAVILGLLTILLAFLGSFITNILVVLLHTIIQKNVPKIYILF